MIEKVKAVKFGGSSLADVEQFRKVYEIIKSDPDRKYIIPSAPGKRFKEDTKVTDMFYRCFELSENDQPIDDIFEQISKRYNDIIKGLGIECDIYDKLVNIKYAIMNHAGRDFAASRGEYLNGYILAKLLNFHFIDAARVIKFSDDGSFDAGTTQTLLSAKLLEHKYAVIPGFYGAMPNGTIKTFSRGGSDVTGAIVARACKAKLYENWTDVSGFLMADPRIVENPKGIEVIEYRELRELSYMGATVLHEDSVFPVRAAGIPINIRNTNAPEHAGTMIVPESDVETGHIITGIAGKKNFSLIAVEKDMLHSESGVGRKLIEIVEKAGLTFEHLPSGIDTISCIVSGDAGDETRTKVVRAINEEIHPDSIVFETGLCLIAVVGRGMVANKGTAAKVFKACADNDINIRMIDQGSSEINIIIGVEEADFEKAMTAIYKEFVA